MAPGKMKNLIIRRTISSILNIIENSCAQIDKNKAVLLALFGFITAYFATHLERHLVSKDAVCRN